MFNFKNLFSVNKSFSNYNLNYDFESIKIPSKKASHIVVFTGGISPEPKLCSVFFKGRPEPDYVIGADSGLETLSKFKNYFKKLDFSPDAILGDMDSIKSKKLIKEFSKTASLEKFNPYKDLTDTELALILASKLKGESSIVTLIGGSGGRIDHLMGIFDLFSSPIAPDFWLTECQILTLVKQDSTLKLLPKTLSSPVSIMRTTASNTKGHVESKGFEWTDDKFRKTGLPSISNVISGKYLKEKKPVEITAKGADFIAACDYDCNIDYLP